MTHGAIFLLLFVTPFVSTSFIEEKCHFETFVSISNSILQGLKFFDSYKNDILIDGLISMRVAADQTEALIKFASAREFENNDEIISTLKYIQKLGNQIAEETRENMTSENDDTDLKNIGLPGNFKKLFPLRKVIRSLQLQNRACDNNYYMFENSDRCLRELLLRTPDETPLCSLATGCAETVIEFGTTDYVLTHQLLFLMLAEQLGCNEALEKSGFFTDITIKGYVNIFCATILEEMEEIVRNNYPEYLQDLFMEQIAFCGMYGFVDFFKNEWVDKILQWQYDNGCFKRKPDDLSIICPQSERGKEYRKKQKLKEMKRKSRIEEQNNSTLKRVKRNDRLLESNCSTHTTTVGVWAQVSNLRFCLHTIWNNES